MEDKGFCTQGSPALSALYSVKSLKKGLYSTVLSLLAALILLPALASGEIDIDRFQYWNACMPMQTSLTFVPDDDPDVTGSFPELIKSILEARLRAAGLYSEDPSTPGILGDYIESSHQGLAGLLDHGRLEGGFG